MRSLKKVFIIAAILIVSHEMLLWASDGVSAQALVDRATINIGDRIMLTVDVNCPAGAAVKFPEIKEGKIGEFEVRDSGKSVKRGFFGKVSHRQWYLVTSYVVGKHQVPEMDIQYKVKGGNVWKSIKTNALSVTVESVLPKEKMPPDIKDVKGVMGYFEINWLVLSGVLALFAIVAAFLMYKFRKKPQPVKLPHESALEELEFARENFMRNSDIKEYYSAISDTIRRYIERSFKLKAPEMTTEEFLNSLRMSATLSLVLKLDQKDLLRDFLNSCDLVKFAKYNPAKGEMESIYLAAKKFIEETKGAS